MDFNRKIGIRALILLIFIVLSGCGGGGGSAGGNGTPNITVTISPKTANLTQGGTQQFGANVNGTTNQAVTWEVVGTGGGTISASGLYTAPTTSGTYSVKATSQAAPAVSITATVKVTAPVPVPTVVISPNPAILLQGGTQQFGAAVSGTTNTAVTWSATGGSISTGGLYTAPATPGTYSVTVTTQATPVATDTVTVTVGTLAWRAVSLAGADFGQDTQAKLMTGTYGTDWIYPSANEAAYFKGKGMNMVRVPFRWERMQPTLNAPLDANELGRLKTLVSGVTGNGMSVLLDVHNYARWGFDSNISSQTNLIGTTAVPVSAFVDLWTRLATEFKGNPNVMFGLMNEPHEIDVTTWVSAANQAIAAIRATGATNTITVGGVSWTGAWSWTNSTWKSDGTYNGDSNAVAMLNVTDSGNNLLFEVHQYLDKNYSGVYNTARDSTSSNDCVYDYSTTLVKFTKWLKDNNRKGLLGEIGAPSTATCNKAVADALSYVQANADVWAGWMWWAAGPWWGADPLSIEPSWSQGDWNWDKGTAIADKPQMSVLAPYLK